MYASGGSSNLRRSSELLRRTFTFTSWSLPLLASTRGHCFLHLRAPVTSTRDSVLLGVCFCQHEMERLADLQLAHQRLCFALASWARAHRSEQRGMRLWFRQVTIRPSHHLSACTSDALARRRSTPMMMR